MKKLLLLLLAFPLVFAGCSDSEDWEDLTTHPIVGSWELEKYSFDLVTSNQEFTDKMMVGINNMMQDIVGEVVTYNENGTATSIVEGQIVSVKYRIKGSTIVYDVPGYGKYNSTFSMPNNQLILVDDLRPMIEQEIGYSSIIKVEKANLRQVAKKVK